MCRHAGGNMTPMNAGYDEYRKANGHDQLMTGTLAQTQEHMKHWDDTTQRYRNTTICRAADERNDYYAAKI
jgi:hypothetical protein